MRERAAALGVSDEAYIARASGDLLELDWLIECCASARPASFVIARGGARRARAAFVCAARCRRGARVAPAARRRGRSATTWPSAASGSAAGHRSARRPRWRARRRGRARRRPRCRWRRAARSIPATSATTSSSTIACARRCASTPTTCWPSPGRARVRTAGAATCSSTSTRDAPKRWRGLRARAAGCWSATRRRCAITRS